MKYRVIIMDNGQAWEDHRHAVVALAPAKDAADVVKSINAWITDVNAGLKGKTYEELMRIKVKRPPYKLPAEWTPGYHTDSPVTCRSGEVPVWTVKR